MGLSGADDEEIHLPVTRAWYLLTGRGCLGQIGHNDFEMREARSPGFFVPVPMSEATCLLVCSVLYTCVYYSMFEKKNLAEILRLEKVTTPAYSGLAGLG